MEIIRFISIYYPFSCFSVRLTYIIYIRPTASQLQVSKYVSIKNKDRLKCPKWRRHCAGTRWDLGRNNWRGQCWGESVTAPTWRSTAVLHSREAVMWSKDVDDVTN